MTRRKQPERALHATVAAFLDRALPSDAYWFPVPNGAKMTPRHVAMLKRTGQLKAGVPDIVIVWRGRRAIFIELKAGRNTGTEAQDEAAKAITLAGGLVTTCRTVDAVAELLGLIQVPLRARLEG